MTFSAVFELTPDAEMVSAQFNKAMALKSLYLRRWYIKLKNVNATDDAFVEHQFSESGSAKGCELR